MTFDVKGALADQSAMRTSTRMIEMCAYYLGHGEEPDYDDRRAVVLEMLLEVTDMKPPQAMLTLAAIEMIYTLREAHR